MSNFVSRQPRTLQQEDTLLGRLLGILIVLRFARIAKYSKRYKLTLHHRRRSGEDVQGTLDSGHIFPPPSFLFQLLPSFLSSFFVSFSSRVSPPHEIRVHPDSGSRILTLLHCVQLPPSLLSSRQGYVVLVLVCFQVAKEGALCIGTEVEL